MKNPSQDNSRFVRAVKDDLDKSIEDLSPQITARLHDARRDALQLPTKRNPWLRPAWGLTTAAAMGMMLMVVWLGQPGESSLPVFEDVELLETSDSFDFYEDLEFYYWLAEHEQTG